MLERMWEPPLGDHKILDDKDRKQKVKLFEARKGFISLFQGLERLRKAQLAPKGTFKACCQEATSGTPKSSGFGVILY